MPRRRGPALAILLGSAVAIATAAVFSLPDGFTFVTVDDSIGVNTTRDGIIEGLQGYGYPFMGGNFAIAGTEVIYKSQNNPYWDPLGAAGHGGDQFHNVSDLAIKPDVVIVGGGENSHSHNDTSTNIINGYLSIFGAAKAIGCKVIVRLCSVTWGGVQLTNDRITKQIAVKAALMAAMAADPANILVIDTDSYDHGHVGWGIGPASGVFENGNSYADGTGHPNCAQGGPRLGKLIADAIIPYVVVGDTSRWTSSGTLLQSQNLNDKWNWPTFGAVSGTGYTGNAAAGLTLSNTGDVTATFAAGTVTSGDVALVVSGSGTATAAGVVEIDVPISGTTFKANRVYNFNLEVEIGNNAGNGDATGVYNLTGDLVVGGSTVASAYSGSTWNPSDLQQRNAVIRGYTALAVASDTTSATLKIKLFTDARALDYKIKLGRAFVRAPRQDPANLKVNLLAIADTYNGSTATLTIERGRTVGSRTFNWVCNETGQSGSITIPQGATQASDTLVIATYGTFSVTVTDPTPGAGGYTLGTATRSFSSIDLVAGYKTVLDASGTPSTTPEINAVTAWVQTVAPTGALPHIGQQAFPCWGRLINLMSPSTSMTQTGGTLAVGGWVGNAAGSASLSYASWPAMFTQNSASWWVSCNAQNGVTGSKPHLGGSATASHNVCNAVSNASESLMVNGASAQTTRTGTSRKGWRGGVRADSSGFTPYFNGTAGSFITQASQTANQQPNYGRNNATYCDDTLSTMGAGDGALTATMIAAIELADYNIQVASGGAAHR
jgi:hypothetical protein